MYEEVLLSCWPNFLLFFTFFLGSIAAWKEKWYGTMAISIFFTLLLGVSICYALCEGEYYDVCFTFIVLVVGVSILIPILSGLRSK